jgi:hypothetical protein
LGLNKKKKGVLSVRTSLKTLSMASESRKDQWQRVRSGGPLHIVPEPGLEEIQAGGLVVKALWEQLKEQQERQDQLYVETCLSM